MMTLEDLRDFILKVRQTEGVAWYMRETTPMVHRTCEMFSLMCYDDDGNQILEIPYIEYRETGHVPVEVLRKIADARARCGVTQDFLSQTVFKGKPSKDEQFRLARNAWIEGGMDAFLSQVAA